MNPQPTYDASNSVPWKRGLRYSSTEGDLPAIAATATEPVSVDSSSPSANYLVINLDGTRDVDLMPFGTDANDEAFNMLLLLWRRAFQAEGQDQASVSPLWIPTYIGTVLVTLSSTTGVANAIVSNLEFLADTVADVDTTIEANRVVLHGNNGGNDEPVDIRIDCNGYEKLSVYFDLTTAASANVLYAKR